MPDHHAHRPPWKRMHEGDIIHWWIMSGGTIYSLVSNIWGDIIHGGTLFTPTHHDLYDDFASNQVLSPGENGYEKWPGGVGVPGAYLLSEGWAKKSQNKEGSMQDVRVPIQCAYAWWLTTAFLSTEKLYQIVWWGQLKARHGPCRTPSRPYWVAAEREQMAAWQAILPLHTLTVCC